MMLNILDTVYRGPKGEDVKALRGWVVTWVESRLDTLVCVMEGKDYVLGDVLLTTVLRILRDR
jgi:hypothetical protein